MDGALRLPEGSWWDWEVIAWTAAEFRPAAGYDPAHHHGLELVFGDPVLVSCPSSFQDPVFRAPAPAEVTQLCGSLGESPPVVVAFEADAGGSETVSCLVAAGRLEIVPGLVVRHTRVDGTPRVRDWPGPPLLTD
ncbi:hypothetical protein [Streptomyces brasiliensis]|uniref:Uncharacterized protein n=1 Tax=Streptomyces brasiliensis TaxID=1954 RepID=A0A917K8M9_9ACTN|nr:hypothetical protein [Streptomyces brasiliensis]GGJ05095.1 hypothetical protein GCM10010121_014460 [Streptomyces brasiliensis]